MYSVEAIAGDARLVAADEDGRVAVRIEGVEDPNRMPCDWIRNSRKARFKPSIALE
jgi:hypothetical protein